MSNLFATPMLANDSLPSVNYLTCNEPYAVVYNPNPYTTVFLNGVDTFNGGSGFPVPPGETVTIPIVGTQDLYAWADTPVGVQVRVIYQS